MPKRSPVEQHFGDVLQEYAAAREQAALIDVSHRSKVEVRGPDRVSFLQNFCTNDVAKLAAGSGCEAFITTAQAKIVARILVWAFADLLWLDADPGMAEKIIQHLDRYLISEQVELVDMTREYAQFALTGSKADAVLVRACGAEPGGEASALLAPMQHAQRRIGAGECQVRRTDALGGITYDIVCCEATAPEVWQAITGAGAKPAGLEAYEILRMEAGTPEYGKDIDETNLPQEVGRDAQAISFTKGCYLGQETVARILSYGHVNRLLVGLEFADKTPATAGAMVMHAGQDVGKVTSSVFSPRLGRAIALAYVRRGHNELGTELEVATGDVQLAARVRSLPFVAE